METIALIILYLIGCVVCQLHIMLMHERVKNWEICYLVLSFLSWVGWAVFLIMLKIREWK